MRSRLIARAGHQLEEENLSLPALKETGVGLT